MPNVSKNLFSSLFVDFYSGILRIVSRDIIYGAEGDFFSPTLFKMSNDVENLNSTVILYMQYVLANALVTKC